jgi:hypothetical protein
MEKREFLAVYDYGMGGLWFKIKACSAAEIRTRYPDLKVFEENERPEWMTVDQEEHFTRRWHFDIDADEGTFLADFRESGE